MVEVEVLQERSSLWQAGLTFLACWLALAWPWLSGRVTIPYDAKAQFLPQVQFLAHSMWQNESPFWTPFVFSGHPQIADPQSLIFSPFLLLALLDPTPGIWAADLTTFLTIAAGGLGLLIWTRDQGWHAGAGLLTALTFAFGAAMSWRVQHIGQVVSLSLLAITLMLLSRALSRGSWRYGLSAGLAAAFMVLQRDQVALLGVYLLSGLVIWRRYFSEYFPIPVIRWALLLHSLAGIGLMLLILGHIYLAIWVRGSIKGMVNGYVSRGWARQHHDRWHEELEAKGEFERDPRGKRQ